MLLIKKWGQGLAIGLRQGGNLALIEHHFNFT